MLNQAQNEAKAELILENGERFEGTAFGYLKDGAGKVTFASFSSGIQELLTDPACAGQILVITNPAVGNYGFNLEDMESASVKIQGLVVREKCQSPNNWRCEMELDGFLKQQKIIGIEGIDTRALVKTISKNGSMKGIITLRGSEMTESDASRDFAAINGKGLAEKATCRKKYIIEGASSNIAVIDLGVKNSTLKELKERDFNITVFPASSGAAEIMASNPGVVLFSSGPGNPAELEGVIETAKSLSGKLPLFGIGLGFSILGLALGCTSERLKYGHHGAGITVKDVKTGLLYVTLQNHNYTLSAFPDGVVPSFANINDGSAEGFSHKGLNVYGVAFYPETKGRSRNTGFFYDMLKELAIGGGANA